MYQYLTQFGRPSLNGGVWSTSLGRAATGLAAFRLIGQLLGDIRGLRITWRLSRTSVARRVNNARRGMRGKPIFCAASRPGHSGSRSGGWERAYSATMNIPVACRATAFSGPRWRRPTISTLVRQSQGPEPSRGRVADVFVTVGRIGSHCDNLFDGSRQFAYFFVGVHS